jgi:hypothetical protein
MADERRPTPPEPAASEPPIDIPDREALEVDRSVPVDPVEAEPAGLQEVKDLETSLGAAASGVLLDEDLENAKQRLHDAQVILAELGYLNGDRGDPGEGVDGVWGPKTRDAVAEFQADHGLDASAQIDAETYEALLAEHEVALGARATDVDEEEDPFAPMRPEKPLDGE